MQFYTRFRVASLGVSENYRKNFNVTTLTRSSDRSSEGHPWRPSPRTAYQTTGPFFGRTHLIITTREWTGRRASDLSYDELRVIYPDSWTTAEKLKADSFTKRILWTVLREKLSLQVPSREMPQWLYLFPFSLLVKRCSPPPPPPTRRDPACRAGTAAVSSYLQ